MYYIRIICPGGGGGGGFKCTNVKHVSLKHKILSLKCVFVVRVIKAVILSYPLRIDYDAQADLIFCFSHTYFDIFVVPLLIKLLMWFIN